MSTRRPTRPILLCAALMVLAGLTAGCSAATDPVEGGSRTPGRQLPYWTEETTVDGVVQQLRLQLPANATDAKAAQQRGFQGDGLLLAFVLPTSEVDAFLTQLKPEEPVQPRRIPFAGESVPVAPFAHLGLPEPDSLPNTRKAQVCAPCKDNIDQLHAAVTPINDQNSRVYLKGID
ncbi:hypothetical protein ACWDYJ_34220 [Streptomyces sp. NPDC003042]